MTIGNQGYWVQKSAPVAAENKTALATASIHKNTSTIKYHNNSLLSDVIWSQWRLQTLANRTKDATKVHSSCHSTCKLTIHQNEADYRQQDAKIKIIISKTQIKTFQPFWNENMMWFNVTLPVFTGLGRCPIVNWDFAGAVSIFGPGALPVVHQWLFFAGLEPTTSRVRVAAHNH